MSQPTVYRNSEFMNDLADKGRGIQSLVYLGGTVTVCYFEMNRGGESVSECSKIYTAEELPETRLRDKYTRVGPDGR